MNTERRDAVLALRDVVRVLKEQQEALEPYKYIPMVKEASRTINTAEMCVGFELGDLLNMPEAREFRK